MYYLRLIVLSIFTIIFFGNIKAGNSITLTYDDGETETFSFSENEITTIYRQDWLRGISISISSKKIGLTDIYIAHLYAHIDGPLDLTEPTVAGVSFRNDIGSFSYSSDYRVDYPVLQKVVNLSENKVQFTITGFQSNKRPSIIKQISASFTIPVFGIWSLQLPEIVSPLLELEPGDRVDRTYVGKKLRRIYLTKSEYSTRKKDEALKKLSGAGFKTNNKYWDVNMTFTHPDFKGSLTISFRPSAPARAEISVEFE